MVPRGAWRHAARRIREAVTIPVAATNRINTPEVAEEILAGGDADIVALGRQMLGDPHFANTAEAGRADGTNTCHGCNQACLDFIFANQASSCLVNPFAGRELDIAIRPAKTPKAVAVVGAGPAGMAAALTAAECGHKVTLFEASGEIGGQFNLAKRIPGKEDFADAIRYYQTRLADAGVDVRLNAAADADGLAAGGFDHVIVAAGVRPRAMDIEGAGRPNVVSYVDAILGRAEIGRQVAIVGSGGIGFDVAEMITAPHGGAPMSIDGFLAHWGIDPTHAAPGAVGAPRRDGPPRKVTLL